MPTTQRTLARNRIQIVQQHLIDGQVGNMCPDFVPGYLVYYGKTTDNTLTELFIAGKGGANSQGTVYYNRLYLPESTLVHGRAIYTSYNATDDTFQMAHSYFAAQNLNGTTAAAFDLDKSGAGNNLEIFLDYDATAGDLDMAHPGSITYALAVDDTGDFLRVNVTGISAKTIYHKVVLEVFSLNELECTSNYFFGDTAAQNDGM